MIFGAVRKFTSLLLVIVRGVIPRNITRFYLALHVTKCILNISLITP